MNLTTTAIRKLAHQAEKAAKIANRNRFLIETYLSAEEAKHGQATVHRSARALFAKLGV